MNVSQSMLITVVDTVDFGGGADTPLRIEDGNVTNERLDAASTPPATKYYSEILTGTQNLDLTALSRSERDTLDASGLKLQTLRLINISTTNSVTLQDGASNAYQINGGDTEVLPPECRLMRTFSDSLADVDASNKNITVSATAGQTYRLTMIFG